MSIVRHIAGHTWHGRKGAVENAFRYRVDYLLLDAEAAGTASAATMSSSSDATRL